MKLIPEWRKAWKLHSVQLSALGATVAGVWVALPEAQQRAVLEAFGLTDPTWLALGGFVAIVIVRLTAQHPPEEPPK
jgi:hypothetical protein